MEDLFSRKTLGKWLVLAGVASVAVCLQWVAAYLMLVVGFAAGEGKGGIHLLGESVTAILLLTPFVGVIAVVLATLRFYSKQRWIGVGALVLLPIWGALVFGLISYFLSVSHTH